MKLAEFDTMNEIIDDLLVDDIEQIKDYASDCRMLGARKTAKYIEQQIRFEQDVDLSIIRMHLAQDFSGC